MTKHVRPIHFTVFLLCFLMQAQFLLAQEPAAPAASETKIDAIIKETQQTVGGKDITGFVWWLPAEFWEESAIEQGNTLEQARTSFAALHDYTMVIVAVGKVGLGNIRLCENVQKGLRSSTYDRGRYSVKRENGVHHFHMLLNEFLARP